MTSLRHLDTTAILLIHCPDQKGILAAVTDFINVNKGNIIYLDQHVDRKAGVFFMRVEWELEQFTIPTEKIEEFFNTLYALKYQMNFRLYFGNQKPKMAIFVSVRLAGALQFWGLERGNSLHHLQPRRFGRNRRTLRYTVPPFSHHEGQQGTTGSA
jgi:predicted amino acid-binding ACT domain protein